MVIAMVVMMMVSVLCPLAYNNLEATELEGTDRVSQRYINQLISPHFSKQQHQPDPSKLKSSSLSLRQNTTSLQSMYLFFQLSRPYPLTHISVHAFPSTETNNSFNTFVNH